MKRIMTALAATTAFAAAPALADHHMDKKDDHAKMDMKGDHMDVSQKDWTKAQMKSEVTALKASQVFLAIDDENDGVISKAEWSDWQNRSKDNTKQFSDYDADSDGDIELSEYLATYDMS
jgi:Ca2+-binding EF-hand superfamily protein